MKKFSFFIAVSILLMSNLIAQGQAQASIIVQNGTQEWAYNNLDTAIFYAPVGSYVYIPGGSFGAVTLNKRLNLIGAGATTDSTNVTGITEILTLTINGANASTVEGISLSGGLGGNGDSLIFSKCKIRTGCAGGFLNGNNNTYKSCAMYNYACGSQEFTFLGNNNLLSNNIISGSAVIIGYNNSFFNNVMFCTSFQNANVANNIFTSWTNAGCGITATNTMFNNNANQELKLKYK